MLRAQTRRHAIRGIHIRQTPDLADDGCREHYRVAPVRHALHELVFKLLKAACANAMVVADGMTAYMIITMRLVLAVQPVLLVMFMQTV